MPQKRRAAFLHLGFALESLDLDQRKSHSPAHKRGFNFSCLAPPAQGYRRNFPSIGQLLSGQVSSLGLNLEQGFMLVSGCVVMCHGDKAISLKILSVILRLLHDFRVKIVKMEITNCRHVSKSSALLPAKFLTTLRHLMLRSA